MHTLIFDAIPLGIECSRMDELDVNFTASSICHKKVT